MYKSNPLRGWVFDLILSTAKTGGRNCLFKIAHIFLSRLQVALLSAACSDILKLRQEICLEDRSSGNASKRIWIYDLGVVLNGLCFCNGF